MSRSDSPKPQPSQNRLLTSEQAADFLGLTLDGLRHQRRAGMIPFVRMGRLIRYRMASLERFVDEHETGGTDRDIIEFRRNRKR